MHFILPFLFDIFITSSWQLFIFNYSLSFTDKDSNGTIDHEELKKCLTDLQVHVSETEDVLYYYCDVDGKEGIQFNEFIVLLCLTYLLMEPASANQNVSITKLIAVHFPCQTTFIYGYQLSPDFEDWITKA